MSSESWQIINVALALATAIGVIATAVFEWLRYRTRDDGPVITLTRERTTEDASLTKGERSAEGRAFTFAIEIGEERWRVAELRGRHVWRPMLAETMSVRQGATASRQRRGPWQRRFHFDPPVISHAFMLHPEAPPRGSLSFRVSPRTRPNVTRRLFVPYVVS